MFTVRNADYIFRITSHPFHLRILAADIHFHIVAVTPQFILEKRSANRGIQRFIDMNKMPSMLPNSAYAMLGVMGPPYEYLHLRQVFLNHFGATARYTAFRNIIKDYLINWSGTEIITVPPRKPITSEKKLRIARGRPRVRTRRVDNEPERPGASVNDDVQSRGTSEPRAAEANLFGNERLFSSVRRKIFPLTKLSSSKGKIRTITNETRNIELVSGIKRPATTDTGTILKKPRLEPTISMNEGEHTSPTTASDMKSNCSKIRTQKEISDNSTVTSPP